MLLDKLFKLRTKKTDKARLKEYEEGRILQVDEDVDNAKYLKNSKNGNNK